MNFFAELKQRRVFKTTAIYAVVAWAIIQVADVVIPRLALPDWTVTFIIVLAALGLPVVIALSWSFDLTERGIERAPQLVGQGSRALGLVGVGMILSLIGFGAYWRLQPQDEDTGPAAHSIAVLPFVDMSPARDQEFFGDGITEEILNLLVQFPELEVPARTSSFSFKGKNLPIREIARQLGVRYVLEGSVRKMGERVRITAQLIDARTDKHLWSQQYDRDAKDVFAVQTEIAVAIADALQVHVRDHPADLVKTETTDPVAHELFLEGLYYWHRREQLPLALDKFRAATQRDPKYVRAWDGVALTYAVLPQYTFSSLETSIRAGKAAAARALELEPRDARAHAALGQIAQELEWDWKSAEKHLDRAVQLDPHFGTAHQWRAELLAVLGRPEEALNEIDLALQIDPLSSVMHNVRALALWRLGRNEEALAVLEATMKRDPAYVAARTNLVGRLMLLGRGAEALPLASSEQTRELIRGAMDRAARPRALEVLASPQLRAQPGSAWAIAAMYLAFGEHDSAAVVLERAANAWTPSIAFFAKDPISKPLEPLPAFQRYLRKVNLAN